jgi:[acyl-carrier-protein] S-malonyltransferase
MDKIAFVFAGQGAQCRGMGADLYQSSAAAKSVFDRADKIRAVKKMCFLGSHDELKQTINAQPGLFCTALAAAAALEENGIMADAAAGFSLGEISAIAYSELLRFEDAYRLVLKRADLMEACAQKNEGGMAAILGLDAAKVEALAAQCGCYLANYNCTGQIVASGSVKNLDKLCLKVQDIGKRTVRLEVGGAFHCPDMREAAEGLAQYLNAAGFNFAKPKIPLYSNYSAAVYSGDYISLISKQVCSPVLWATEILNISLAGINTFIEVGAGKVLSGLIKKILPDAVVYNMCDKNSLDETIKKINGGRNL